MLSSAIAKIKSAPKVLLLLCSISAALIVCGWYGNTHAMSSAYIYLHGTRFTVQVAHSPEQRTQGLSGADSLAERHGMLFAYDHPVVSCFWMHGMYFSVDMLWLDQKMKVLALQPDVLPSSYPRLFCSPIPATYGLEVPAGTTQQLHIRVGDSLHF